MISDGLSTLFLNCLWFLILKNNQVSFSLSLEDRFLNSCSIEELSGPKDVHGVSSYGDSEGPIPSPLCLSGFPA